MKWTENGVSFEGTVQEYKELHADGFQQQPLRTHRGKHVIVDVSDNESADFPTVQKAAEWITQQTGRYLSASHLGKMLDENGHIQLDRFTASTTLFNNNNEGAENAI